MKSIAVYFKDPAISDDPIAKPKFRAAYFELLKKLEDRGVYAAITRHTDTYLGGMHFSRHWIIGEDEDPASYRELGELEADLIFNRGRLPVRGRARLLNPPEVQVVTENKALTYGLFGDMQARSFVLETPADLSHLDELPGDEVVVKGFFGMGGKEVRKLKKTELAAQVNLIEQPYLVQALIDTSAGIPGMIDCEHDLRVLVLGGVVIGGVLRRRDIWWVQGGAEREPQSRLINPEEIPEALHELTAKIDNHFAGYKRFYCADYMYGADGRWYLIELNATPGMIPAYKGNQADVMLNRLADYMVSMVNEA